MRKNTLSLLSVTLVAILLGCNSHNADRRFPEVKNLSEFKETVFVPTLDHEISANNNAVYAVSLLYAWDEVRKILGVPLEIDPALKDLMLLQHATSFKNVLHEDEYSVSGEVQGDMIVAKAKFNKSLPFAVKMTPYRNRLSFNGIKVASFGPDIYDYRQSYQVKVVYYKDDENFIIKLNPKDKQHEIVLFMSEGKFGTMADMIREIDRLTLLGNEERKQDEQWWKYELADDDEVVIPKFKFNIETNYTCLEGNTFMAGNRVMLIKKAWQRTAFLLDEKGAEVESVAEVAALESLDDIKPKKMIFDKPFLLILKRKDATQPYFGMWVANTELMVKEQGKKR